MGKVSINNIGSQGKNETMYIYINKYQINIITYNYTQTEDKDI